MADLRPLGSEKLQGMDKIKRILEIAKYNEAPKTSTNILETTNYTIRLSDGNVYGIVKEKLGYIIKSGLNESTLEYNDTIRHRKYYRSYSEAMKRLNIMATEINRVTGHQDEIPLIGEDVKKKFINEKRFVLKQKKNAEPTPPPADTATPPPAAPTPPAGDMGTPPPPAGDMGTPPPPAGDMGGDMGTPPPPAGDMGADMGGDMGTPPPPAGDMGADMGGDMGTPPPPADDMGGDMGTPPPSDDMGGDMGSDGPELPQPNIGDEGEDQPAGPTGLKTIQKLTGRLSQRLRGFEKMKSEDIKYVINSIISAIDLKKLDDEDRDDILDKLESFDEYGVEGEGDFDISDEDLDLGDENMGSNEESGMNEMPPPPPPVSESKVQNILSKYFKFEPEEKKLSEEKKQKNFLKTKLKEIEIKNEIRNLSESKEQMKVSLKLFNENAKFVGKTNKENLVFIKNGKQIRVTSRGQVL
jgi:hypothetical protein